MTISTNDEDDPNWDDYGNFYDEKDALAPVDADYHADMFVKHPP